MTREALHKLLDETLDEHGFQKNVEMQWGSLLIQIQFEKGKAVLKIKERHTERPDH